MSLLRERMTNALQLRRLAPKTQDAYLRAVTGLSKHYKKSPDEIKLKEVEDYLVYLLQERKLSWSTCDQCASGLEFFYRAVMKQTRVQFKLPRRRHEQKLPEILNKIELKRLFGRVRDLKHRMVMMTAYAGGLRVSEVLGLKVSDIDSQRMLIRVTHAKGNKDRYTVLSLRLLEQLRIYWQRVRPQEWLFPGKNKAQPLRAASVQKMFVQVKRRARIAKTGGMHMLRHAFATHLLEAGVESHTIQRLLGHRYLQTTCRYMRVRPERMSHIRSPLDDLPQRTVRGI